MFKRYSYQGGVCDPLVISWPKGIKARGEVRHQYHHSTDIYPTILEACGIEMPKVVNGAEQSPLAGVSMVYSFDGADAPTKKETQYYEMLGTRGIWHKGWKAVTEHGPFTGMGKFDKDRWQLFHTDEDRSEAHDLAEQHPDKVKELADLWMQEAIANKVLPINDLTVAEIFAMEVPNAVPPSGQWTYYPGHHRGSRAICRHRPRWLLQGACRGRVRQFARASIFAHGSRFGGHSLFVKDGTLTYAYNFLGIPPETRFSDTGTSLRPACRRRRVHQGVRWASTASSTAPPKLYIDDQPVAERRMRDAVRPLLAVRRRAVHRL